MLRVFRLSFATMTTWAALTLLLLFSISPASYAASFTVNDSCSLADAITAANTDTATGGCAAGSGADTITLSGNITLSASLPTITTEMRIESDDADAKRTISGNNQRRIFKVTYPGNLTINNLELTDGWAYDGDRLHVRESDEGGAIYAHGEAGERFVILTINNSVIKNSTAAQGGAVYADWTTLVVNNSSFTGNRANDEGGAIHNFTWGSMTITNSSFSNNSSIGANSNSIGDGNGGAISVGLARTALTITNTIVSGNSAAGAGGGIYYYGVNRALTIKRSTFSNNSAATLGGAVHTSADTSIENTTFSGNSANFGGMIYTLLDGDVDLKHITAAGNSASNGGGIYRYAEILEGRFMRIRLYNSIISGNSGGDCVGGLHTDVSSIVGDGSCSAGNSGDPRLGDLVTADSGQKYYPLLDAQSPAINTADSNHCTSTDQLGNARPVGSGCDIGAIENLSGITAPTATLEPTSTPEPSATPEPTATPEPSATPEPTATNTPNATELADIQATSTAERESSIATSTAERENIIATSTAERANSLCRNITTGYYLLFSSTDYLVGTSIPYYSDNNCRDRHDITMSTNSFGIAYSTSGLDSASAICQAGNAKKEGNYVAEGSLPYDNLWQCVPSTESAATSEPTATNTPEPTATNAPESTATSTALPTATNTSPPATSKDIAAVRLVSNQPGIMEVSWDAPSDTPQDYRINWGRVGEDFPSYTGNVGNGYPTSPSFTMTDLDEGVLYKVRVRARYGGSAGDWSSSLDALVMAAPTATNTPMPTSTNMQIPPTNTQLPPTSTQLPPTNTQIPPTNTSIPPTATNTEIPADARDIRNLRLVSNEAGVIGVSWDAPAESAHDYRVNWGPVGQDFPSYKGDVGNSYPTSNSYSITGVESGARYKVRVRARFNGSSGDWSSTAEVDVSS